MKYIVLTTSLLVVLLASKDSNYMIGIWIVFSMERNNVRFNMSLINEASIIYQAMPASIAAE
jgi:hypothetical protein